MDSFFWITFFQISVYCRKEGHWHFHIQWDTIFAKNQIISFLGHGYFLSSPHLLRFFFKNRKSMFLIIANLMQKLVKTDKPFLKPCIVSLSDGWTNSWTKVQTDRQATKKTIKKLTELNSWGTFARAGVQNSLLLWVFNGNIMHFYKINKCKQRWMLKVSFIQTMLFTI